MKGTWMIFMVAIFLLLVLAWLVQETDPGRRYGSKTYHLLLSWLMELDITLAHIKQYFRMGKMKGVAEYRGNDPDLERIRRKEQRLQEFRREGGADADYKKRERYNRKVLE